MISLGSLYVERGVCLRYNMPSNDLLNGLQRNTILYNFYKELIDDLMGQITEAVNKTTQAEAQYNEAVNSLNAEIVAEKTKRFDILGKIKDFSKAAITAGAYVGTGVGTVTINAQQPLIQADTDVGTALEEYKKQVDEAIPNAEKNVADAKTAMEAAQNEEKSVVNSAVTVLFTYYL